jgi:hypothetical protein
MCPARPQSQLPPPRWAFSALPRLPFLRDVPPKARAALSRQARERTFTGWQWGLLGALPPVAFVAPIAAAWWLAPSARWFVIGIAAGPAAGLLLGVGLRCAYVNPRVWQRFRGVLSEHGRCARCGYDLTGTPSAPACPECGMAVRPDLGTRRFEETAKIDADAELRRTAILLPSFIAGVLAASVWYFAATRRLPHWLIPLAGGLALLPLGWAVSCWDIRRFRRRRGLCRRCGCEPRGGPICCDGCEDPSRSRPGLNSH